MGQKMKHENHIRNNARFYFEIRPTGVWMEAKDDGKIRFVTNSELWILFSGQYKEERTE